MTNQPPDGLIPAGASPVFTQDTLPTALQAEHTLAPGHWAVLNVLEGSLRFVNLDTGEEQLISTPGLVTIHPGLPHRVALEGRVRCRIDFFREPPDRGISGLVRKLARKDRTGKDNAPEYVIVEDLPDALKEGYLSVLVWLVHFDDSQIDALELCEIQLLMTQLRCNPDVRKAVRAYLEDPETLQAEAQIARMLELFPPESDGSLALRCSLMKDAIRVCRATSEGPAEDRVGIRKLAEMLDLDDEKVKFIEVACEQDEKILDGELSDSQIANAAKGLAAQATAVGVPVAAVYLSGSVTGLSAAGIASGLATLGLGGVLGLSAMVTGIGVAIVAGGVAFKGVRWALGGSERGRASLRELMLQEVLRIHQGAIINLGEDMAHFGERIAALSNETDRNRAAIDKLFREVTLLSRSAGALTRLGERASGLESDLREEAAGQATR